MATSFGGAVKLTGESEYRKALQNITQNLKEVTSEMKLVAAQFDKNDKSNEALSAKSEVLNKKLEAQKEKVSTLKKQYEAMASQYEKNAAKNEALAKKYDEEKTKLTNLEKTLGTTSDEYKEQAEKVNELAEKLKKSEANQEANAKSLSNMRIQLNNAESDVAKTTREVESLADEMENGAKSSDELGDAVEKAGDSADKAGGGGFTVFKGVLADLVANVITSAVSKMKDLISSTIEVGASFDSSMAKVQAVSGATDEELQKLRDTAKAFGSTTKFSASESADALGYMALAGWDANTSCEALGGVLNLAAASGMDLARASDMVTDYLSAFGMQAEDSGYFADLLAYAQGNANTSAEQLGEAYKNCAANMNSAGQDIETTTALLAMMSNQGLKGSEAGTALNAVMRDMTSKMKDGAIQIGKTKVAVQDSQGNFRDLSDILKDVEKATAGMGDAQKQSALQSTFTADSIKGLNLILNAGVDNANDFEAALRKSKGTAKEAADVMNDNLNGDLTTLNSQIESVQIALYEKFEPALRSAVDALSGLVDGVMWLVDHSTEVVAAITAIAVGVGAYVAYTTALKVMEEGWKSLTIVTKAQAAAQAVLNAVMSANPIGIVIALVAALVAAFIVLWNKSEAFRNFFTEMWETIKKAVGEAWESISGFFTEAWDSITEKWGELTNFFGDLWGGFKDAAKGAWDNVKETYSTVSTWYNDHVIKPVTDFFVNMWNKLKDSASEAWEKVKEIFEPVIDFYKEIFTKAFDAIKEVWDKVKEYFSLVWDSIKTIFSVVKDVLSGNFSDAWDKIKELASKWKDFFSGVWDDIKRVFDGVATFFRNKFSDAWTAIKNVFAPFTSFFSGLWDKVKTTFSTLGTKIGDAIGKSVKSGINGIISQIERVINNAIGIINGAIDLINYIPGVNVGYVGRVNFPRLAKGGVVNGATFAQIGEDGAEAVVPLENNIGWITKVAEQLANALATPLANATKNVVNSNTSESVYNETVDAFKDALGQMKIVLDDEEMGHFIEKTVADAIYT